MKACLIVSTTQCFFREFFEILEQLFYKIPEKSFCCSHRMVTSYRKWFIPKSNFWNITNESFIWGKVFCSSKPHIYKLVECAYQGVRNGRFFGKFDMLCFFETPVLRFVLLPYVLHLESIAPKIKSFH